ncbi:MAG TPA: quinolinate synthase NadA [Candidatus Thermoplasmatota archaeon]
MTRAPPALIGPTAIEAEAERLFSRIGQPERWDLAMCRVIAPITLEINQLKRQQNAVILAHSYQTPDIVYGVADHVGDSYGLSLKARDSTADTIVFSSVRFMAETAKIVNPHKRVLIPEPTSGCSLADGITADQVRAYRRKHPEAAIVAYVNTSAAVKALADVCVTSANYLKICRALPEKEIVFLPDRYMGAHLQKALAGEKTVYIHDAACVVHEQFRPETARTWRDAVAAEGRKLHILAHPECAPNVLLEADFIGSSEAMLDYARKLESQGKVDVLPITECGTADRMKAELPNVRVVGACSECPFMKETDLRSILTALKDTKPHHEVRLPAGLLASARKSLDRMFAMTQA